MDKNLIASSSIKINSSDSKIWEVLTNSEKIKIYLFGTIVTTNWQENNPITFEGEYEGHKYKDKGNVITNRVNELLIYNYWSSFSGLEDKAENYALVSYIIEKSDDNSYIFTWYQQGFTNEEGKCHTEESLKSILKNIKSISENE